MRPYRGLFGHNARRRCPHSLLRGIYGDEINRAGGWRLWCADCWRYLDGPVSLASSRSHEVAPVPPTHTTTTEDQP